MAYPSSLNPLAPGYSPWDDSHLLNSLSGGSMASQDEYTLGVEGMLILYLIVSQVLVDIFTIHSIRDFLTLVISTMLLIQLILDPRG